MALGAARRSEQERLLVLQKSARSSRASCTISLAQSLSWAIQMSLLQRALSEPARMEEANAILVDLRSGKRRLPSAARAAGVLSVSSSRVTYLLRTAVSEYRERGGTIELELELGDCNLSPNQESVHVLQIVRESLSNMLRHARARRACTARSEG